MSLPASVKVTELQHTVLCNTLGQRGVVSGNILGQRGVVSGNILVERGVI